MIVLSHLPPPQYPLSPSLLSLADIDLPATALCLGLRLESGALFERLLTPVLCVLFVVDAMELEASLRPRFCNNSKALGKSPVLDTLKRFRLGIEALTYFGGNKMRRWEGFGGFVNLGSKGWCHGRIERLFKGIG
jgi:hypothetical protein